MLRTLPVLLGLLLGFSFPEMLGHGTAIAATKQRHRPPPTREPSTRVQKASAASKKKQPPPRTAKKKKAAEVKPPPAPESPNTTAPTVTAAGSTPPSRGPTRIDFDDRLIQGQTNKSGAVYLYDRKELKTRSMIKKRENFRDEILAAVYGS